MNNKGFGVVEILLLLLVLGIMMMVMKERLAMLFSFLISGIR